MAYAYLLNRALIALSGEDIIEFLQGIISNDARKLAANVPLYAALLTPQGRYLHDFFLVPYKGHIFLDVESSRAPDLLARLKLYKLRSKVTIEPSNLSVAAIWGEGGEAYEDEHIKRFPDPRLAAMGQRAIVDADENTITNFFSKPASDIRHYNAHRIALGVPDTQDMVIEKSLLLECGFEQLHGVDFNKGCYVGQEVTARSKFRGQVRKSFYQVTSDDALPPAGTPVLAGDGAVGEMRSSRGNIGLALLNGELYEAAIARGVHIESAGVKLHALRPAWAAISQSENTDADAK